MELDIFFIIRLKWPVLSSGEKIHRKNITYLSSADLACWTLKINHYSNTSIGDDLIYNATYVTTFLCYILISKLIILKLIAFRNFWCILIKKKSSTTELEEKVRLIPNFFLLQYTFFMSVSSTMPSRHMTLIQRRLNVDATSWRCIDVDATLCKRHVPAGCLACVLYIEE